MNFVVQDEEGNEHGPMDQETLEKWVETGRVFPDTPVRNALLSKWREAKELDFLQDYFNKQKKSLEKAKNEQKKKGGFWSKESKELDAKLKKHQIKEEGPAVKTAFDYKYTPNPASIFLRLCSLITDLIMIGIYAIILYLGGSFFIYLEFDPNNVFYFFYFVFICSVLFYYGIGLGIFAQTIGMWFWGIFIVKKDISEVYMLRAYVHFILMLIFGIFMPFFVIVTPNKRGLHDLLAGTRIIRIAAKPKS